MGLTTTTTTLPTLQFHPTTRFSAPHYRDNLTPPVTLSSITDSPRRKRTERQDAESGTKTRPVASAITTASTRTRSSGKAMEPADRVCLDGQLIAHSELRGDLRHPRELPRD